MKKLLLLLLCVPLMFSCGDGDTDNLQREITHEMMNDGYTGKGTYTYGKGEFDGDKCVGEWKNGNLHGQGTMTYANGDKYVGEWKDDKRHGQGTYTYDGEKYAGEWKDDLMHGHGIYTHTNGDKYVGEWKNGIMHGQGTLTVDGEVYYEGLFVNGKFLGE